mmetsp:Transcript_117851/g.214251  ORF Transcript_117851/g.214251 Transcript_117851/m.214251 type:complete len:216 (+) Transcript_117851:218-865(+)
MFRQSRPNKVMLFVAAGMLDKNGAQAMSPKRHCVAQSSASLLANPCFPISPMQLLHWTRMKHYAVISERSQLLAEGKNASRETLCQLDIQAAVKEDCPHLNEYTCLHHLRPLRHQLYTCHAHVTSPAQDLHDSHRDRSCHCWRTAPASSSSHRHRRLHAAITVMALLDQQQIRAGHYGWPTASGTCYHYRKPTHATTTHAKLTLWLQGARLSLEG